MRCLRWLARFRRGWSAKLRLRDELLYRERRWGRWNALTFYVELGLRGNPNTVVLPSEQAWECMPEWAKARSQVIEERVREVFSGSRWAYQRSDQGTIAYLREAIWPLKSLGSPDEGSRQARRLSDASIACAHAALVKVEQRLSLASASERGELLAGLGPGDERSEHDAEWMCRWRTALEPEMRARGLEAAS